MATAADLLTHREYKYGFVTDVARQAILSSLTTVDEITYRQDVLADCMAHPPVVRELYALAVDAIRQERRGFLGDLLSPSWTCLSACFGGCAPSRTNMLDNGAPPDSPRSSP